MADSRHNARRLKPRHGRLGGGCCPQPGLPSHICCLRAYMARTLPPHATPVPRLPSRCLRLRLTPLLYRLPRARPFLSFHTGDTALFRAHAFGVCQHAALMRMACGRTGRKASRLPANYQLVHLWSEHTCPTRTAASPLPHTSLRFSHETLPTTLFLLPHLTPHRCTPPHFPPYYTHPLARRRAPQPHAGRVSGQGLSAGTCFERRDVCWTAWRPPAAAAAAACHPDHLLSLACCAPRLRLCPLSLGRACNSSFIIQLPAPHRATSLTRVLFI